MTFWDSVARGVAVLTYWETYVAAIEYLAIFLVPMSLVRILIDKSSEVSVAIGCLSFIIIPVLQVFAITVFVLTLSPIMLGLSEDASWSFPWMILQADPVFMLKFVGQLLLLSILLAFIPIIGQIQSLNTLILGGFSLALVLKIIEKINPVVATANIDPIPGFWFIVGILIISGVLVWIGFLLSAVVLAAMESIEEGIGQLLIFPFIALFGFIPVFIYGAWLGSQLAALK